MYLTVRKYHKVEGDREKITESIKTGFVPLISKSEGFIDYYCLFADDDTLVSVSVFRDARGAQESVRAAAKWIQHHLSSEFPEKPEVVSGNVFAYRHMEQQKAA
jgi:hypothetical protein